MKKILYISVILNVLALLMIGRGVSALSVSKEVQDLVGYVQSIIFTDDGTPSGNIKVRISGGEGMIYGSGGIWIGKGGGNGIYSNGTNVGIGTTDLSNRLNVGGDVLVKNESKVKMGLNGNSYIQGTGNIMNIVSQGYVNMEGVRNYIRGGVVTFGSTWYDENDNNYFLDLNNNTKLSNLNAKGLVTINTAGNAELDLKSGSLGHWGIYHDTVSEELRMWNGGSNRLSIGKGGEIYINNTILVDGSKNWKGNILQADVGGTGVGSCLSGETIIWNGGNWICGIPETSPKLAGGISSHTEDDCTSAGGSIKQAGTINLCNFVPGTGGQTCSTLNCNFNYTESIIAQSEFTRPRYWSCPSGWSRYQGWGEYSVVGSYITQEGWYPSRPGQYLLYRNSTWIGNTTFVWGNNNKNGYYLDTGRYGGAMCPSGMNRHFKFAMMEAIGCY